MVARPERVRHVGVRLVAAGGRSTDDAASEASAAPRLLWGLPSPSGAFARLTEALRPLTRNMQGLAVVNGDIVVGQSGYQMVSGQAKVLQDLTLATQEPYGSDQYHPGWGSYLDGYIGQDPKTVESLAQTEVMRLVSNYMTVQQYQQSQAMANGQSSPFNNEDYVTGITSLSASQDLTSITVQAGVQTASGSTVGLSTTVGG